MCQDKASGVTPDFEWWYKETLAQSQMHSCNTTILKAKRYLVTLTEIQSNSPDFSGVPPWCQWNQNQAEGL